jgi:hypothetical protein
VSAQAVFDGAGRLAARHFIVTGRYPGFGARFDIWNGHDGRVIGASYRFEGCVCGSCLGWRDVDGDDGSDALFQVR